MTAPVSPAAVVAAALLRAIGVRSAGEARAILREHVTYTLPRMSAAAILEVLNSFDDGAAVPEQRHTETWAPGEVRRGQGARYGGVDEAGEVHDGPEEIE